MSDDTNELLRQILDAQRQLLIAYQKEMERTSEFRITVMESQKAAQRRAVIVAIIIGVGVGLLVLGTLAAKSS